MATMASAIAELVLDEGKWLFASTLLATIVLLAALRRAPAQRPPGRAGILWAMNLFYGCMIGTMAFGHLLAVTVKLAQGTLRGSWLALYPLGLVLAMPAWWLALRAARYGRDEERHRNRMLALNGWLGLALLALGLHNLPLAAPAALAIAYQLHTRRAVGWTLVTLALAANLALLVGSLVFLASGQSFEQISGLE
jgi:hypothetical protein